MLKTASILLLMGIIPPQVYAQSSESQPPPSHRYSPATRYRVLVNGVPLSVKVIEIEGVIYLPLQAVVAALGVEVSLSADEIRIHSGKGDGGPIAGERTTIKGTLTYFFNTNFGTKPDTGTRVWLLEPSVADSLGRMTGRSGKDLIPVDWMITEGSGELRVGPFKGKENGSDLF